MKEKGPFPVKKHGLLRGSSQEGFSLVEILIAVAVFSIGMLAVAAMQTTAMRGNALSGNVTRAVMGGNHDKVEELIAYGKFFDIVLFVAFGYYAIGGAEMVVHFDPKSLNLFLDFVLAELDYFPGWGP